MPARTNTAGAIYWFSLLCLGLAALIALAPAAHAGTLARVINAESALTGPGARYDALGSVTAGQRVTVTRCSGRWCKIALPGPDGWVSRGNLGFGQFARGPFSGPKLFRGHAGPGEICFHDGANYTGRTVCAKSGMVIPDLTRYGRDNAISSISVTGSVSALVCRDHGFTSACTLFVKSEPRLGRYLNNAVSSYRVY